MKPKCKQCEHSIFCAPGDTYLCRKRNLEISADVKILDCAAYAPAEEPKVCEYCLVVGIHNLECFVQKASSI